MRVLITGAGGRLARDLVHAYVDHDVTGLLHAELDVADEAAVVAAVGDHRPDLVVHTAAMTDVDACEADPDRAHEVNALGAWWVARACALTGAELVHVSTDYVFGASPPRHGPAYTEFDPPAPVNAYGASKAAAEMLVRESLERHYIVRTAWLHGGRERGFVATILDRAGGDQPLRVVGDQRGCPTASRDLAQAIRALSVTGRHGTYHRVNAGSCSRHELAVATLALARIDREVTSVTSDQMPHRAPRPAATVLDDHHSRLAGLDPMPPWRDALARTVAELVGR